MTVNFDEPRTNDINGAFAISYVLEDLVDEDVHGQIFEWSEYATKKVQAKVVYGQRNHFIWAFLKFDGTWYLFGSDTKNNFRQFATIKSSRLTEDKMETMLEKCFG